VSKIYSYHHQVQRTRLKREYLIKGATICPETCLDLTHTTISSILNFLFSSMFGAKLQKLPTYSDTSREQDETTSLISVLSHTCYW